MTMQSMMKMPMTMPGNMTGMPTQAMMPMMMATMTMKMGAGKAHCEFVAAQGMDKTAFQNCCEMMKLMVAAGMPIVMQSGNMAMMCVSDSPTTSKAMPMMMPMMSMVPSAVCMVRIDLRADTMTCQMMPGQGMDAGVFDASCQLMDKMMQLGLPMTMMCNGSPVMFCTV
jgi:hypothetical protein